MSDTWNGHHWLALALGLLVGTCYGGDTRDDAAQYQIINDILYRRDPGLTEAMRERCRLDLYYPRGGKDFPTVVWFHGGGLTKGNKEIPAALRNKGFAVVAVNYRLAPGTRSPAFIEDAAAAIAWTFQNIERHGGSRRRIFVCGHSAGGYLACMVALDRRWLMAHQIDANILAGVVPLSGQSITHFTIRAERGIKDKTPVIDDLAPVYHVRKDAPPMLLITGDRERELLGRYEETAYFWRMLREAGHRDVTLHELQGFDHGGMADPAFPLLVRFVRERTRNPAGVDGTRPFRQAP